MFERCIGLWLYQNCGGEAIQQRLIEQLNERNIRVLPHLDLSKGYAFNGKVYCEGVAMNELDLFFTYNAGQQTLYQMYLYQTLSQHIPTINNYRAFALTEDKFRTNDLLMQHGIPTPDHILVNKNELSDLKQHLAFWNNKAICKPVDGWGGNGLFKITQAQDLDLIAPFIAQQNAPQFYLERIIENDFTDYRVDIVNGEFIACYGRQAAKGEWKTNVTSGGHVIHREPNDAIVNLALKATKATGLEIAGVDILYDQEKEQYIVIEVNGIPAFATPEQELFGIDFNERKIQALVNLIDERTKSQTENLSSTLLQDLHYDTAK